MLCKTIQISISYYAYFLFESGHLAQYLNGGLDPYKIYTSCLSNFMVLGKILLQSNKIKSTRVNRIFKVYNISLYTVLDIEYTISIWFS